MDTYPPQGVRDAACSMLNDPAILSEYFVSQVLRRRHKGAIQLHDARELIDDYLHVLCDGASNDYDTASGSLMGRTKE